MADMASLYRTDDFKNEKHVPVIQCPDTVEAGVFTNVSVCVGAEVEHPNTTEHHIRWIKLLFLPEGAKAAYELGNFEFCAHGESATGPNEGPVHTNHAVSVSFKTTKPGTLLAGSYCNIHGLWESSKPVMVG